MNRFDVDVSGGRLAVWHTGAPLGTAPVVLAAHGITANAMSWLAVARAVGDRFSFVAADLRGRARSNGVTGPFGMAVHRDDQLAILDALDVERALLVGHSMGAYVMARLAADHPDRARAVVLVDGGLTLPVPPDLDVQNFLDAFLGPAIARLRQMFASREAYHDFWRAHPAFGNDDVLDADLVAYTDHDLEGVPPTCRSSVREAAVRADGAEVHTAGEPAHRLTMPAVLLRAPRGLLDEPNPMIPADLAATWQAEDPDQRDVVEVPDVNHYTIVLGRGCATVADAIVRYGAHP